MTAMHPDSGVPWTDARNSVPSDIEQSLANCNELWYSTSRCQPRFDPAAANAQLAELINLINAGCAPYDCSKLDNVQLAVRHLIQRGQPRAAFLTGGNQSFSMTLNPAPCALVDGMTVTIIPNVNNGGLSGISTNGGPLFYILRNDGLHLKANDLTAGHPAQIIYVAGVWYMTGLVASQAIFPSQARFETPGTYTFVVPAGVYALVSECYGGGGGGGTSNVNVAGGGGGAAGGYSRMQIVTSPGSAYTVTVGAGGRGGGFPAGGITENGITGGLSAISGLHYATGGSGGNAAYGAIPGLPQPYAGIGVGGYVNLPGAGGSSGASGTNADGGYTGYGGLGGACPGTEGGGGGAMSTGAAGTGVSKGGGGSGGGSAAGINSPGGFGADGGVIISFMN